MLTTMLSAAVALQMSGGGGPPPPTPAARAIRYRVEVAAPLETAWRAWTTRDGAREWFAPDVVIELRPLGLFEVLFMPQAPAGLKGAENNRVLAVQDQRLFSFTWDAPPNLPEARAQRTSVAVRFDAMGNRRTRIWFEQTGWGQGGQWDESFTYFTDAWRSVLAMLLYRFERGVIDWAQAPSDTTLAPFARRVSTW